MNKDRLINIFWLLFENFGLVFLSALSFFSFAIYLTPTQLGLGALTIVLCEIVSSFYCAVFEAPLIRRGAKSRKELSSVFWFGGMVSATTILILAGFYYLFDSDSSVWKMLLLSTVSVLSTTLARPYIAILRCKREFKKLALRTLWGKIIGSGCGIASAVLGAGEWALIIQLTTMNLVAFLILLRSASSFLFVTPSKERFISILREGTPVGARKLISGFLGRGIVIILSVVTTPAIIGYYSFGRRIVELPKQALLAAINSYAMPVFTSRYRNKKVIAHLFTELTICIFLITLPLFVLLSIFGKELITDIFGEKWIGAIPFFVLFAFISGAQMLVALPETLQAAFGRSKIGLYAELGKAIALLVITFHLAAKYGLLAIALVIALDFIFNLVIRYYVVYKLIPNLAFNFWIDIIKITVGTAVTALTSYYAIEFLQPTSALLITLGVLSVIMQGLIMMLLFGFWHKRILNLLSDSH
ncbi:oligosaccharide flippase family protein [Glaciecola sp. MF2-115]|uniref:oligosaccharide flippase family protein n=1 Tax=Glaciecola sp. MF2-115 TaxID=3384827 RepID=UPI0039A1CD48